MDILQPLLQTLLYLTVASYAMLALFLIVGACLPPDGSNTMNKMNQVKRIGVITKQRFIVLPELLKGVIAARPSIPWSALARYHTFRSYEPVLAAFAPAAEADLIQSIARQIVDRSDVKRRQLSIHLEEAFTNSRPTRA
jgi:hypothetical protein